MLQLRLSPQAENDLEKIYLYTFETWGEIKADQYQDRLYDQMTGLLSNPFLGSKYEFKPAYRKLKVAKHLVFYRIEEERLIVIRILHQSMDIMDQL